MSSDPSPPKAPHPLPPNFEGQSCPVDHSSRSTWTNLASGPLHNPHTIPPSLRGKEVSTKPLSTEKEISSIPRGEHSSTPGEEKWVYPSEAQFYAALLRKHQASPLPSSPGASTSALASTSTSASHGEASSSSTPKAGIEGEVEVSSTGQAITNGNVVKPPNAQDMSVVVPIHNAVNERTWGRILDWEGGRGGDLCGGIRLVSFRGDSKKLSPKARWNILLGYQRPFDRHDWVIDRCGTKVRYVIDYYTGKTNAGPFSFYIDARPALDSWEGIKMRLDGIWRGLIGR